MNNNSASITDYEQVVYTKDPNSLLKKGIWLYFFLLIFEGALRKWFLPGLATPLLIVRDPIALWLVVLAWKSGQLRANPYLVGMVVIGILSTITALLVGHGNLAVAVYGARILVIHFPLIFVIGSIFDSEDVIKMGKVVLLISIPMAVVTALQFFSPQSSWINIGVGGMEDEGFTGALGYFRPTGTFSFNNGTTLFFGFISSFVFYFWLNNHGINKFVLWGATGALLAAIPLSISRGLFFQVAIALVFTVYATSRKPEYVGRMLKAGLLAFIGLAVFSQTSFFQTALEVLTTRFTLASKAEGGLQGTLIDRFLGGMVGAIFESSDQPFFGYGIGMGTNVGSILLTGETAYLIAEGEWGRLIGEMGPLLGITAILLRVGLVLKIAFASFQKLGKGDLLPWLLLSFGLVLIPQAQWAQPTALGFSTLVAGLMIASFRVPIHQNLYTSIGKGIN